jgi:hypothetical protein
MMPSHKSADRSTMRASMARERVGESEGRSPSDKTWFATFMFLDAGCAISSRQLEYVMNTVTAVWHRMLGRPSPSRTLP